MIVPTTTRRSLLVGGACAAATAMAGCRVGGGREARPTPSPTPSPTSDPAASVLTAAAADESRLIALYDVVLTARPALAPGLRPLRADHAAHLERLVSAGAGPPVEPSVGPLPVLRDNAAAVRALSALSRTVGSNRARDCLTTPAATAPLLGAIAACESTHVAVHLPAALLPAALLPTAPPAGR